VAKKKLQRFAQLASFNNVFQPHFSESFNKDHHLKGTWHKVVFYNDNPITLELGCGKGEYTTGLARHFTDRNFIGVDIKGARMWRGAKDATDNHLGNVAFLRTNIESISSFFSENEVDEIWLTFPDPQAEQRRTKKRLSSSVFLNKYRKILKDNGFVHLKTDSTLLHEYTLKVIKHNQLEIIECTADLYSGGETSAVLSIRTHYENIFLNEGKKITYLKFRLPKNKEITEPEND